MSERHDDDSDPRTHRGSEAEGPRSIERDPALALPTEDTGGWTFEEQAAAGPIGGHAGTRVGQGMAGGDTLGGTTEAAHDPSRGIDDATLPEGAAEGDASLSATEGRTSRS